MAAATKTDRKKQSRLADLMKWIRNFISSQRASISDRAASRTLTGINLMPDDVYIPSKLTEHPGIGSHEEIEPMK